MNIEYLKYALEIQKTKSINKAAENLYISQPNLSRAIKKLEEDLGITIFNRTTHGIEITLAGEDFLSHARVIIDEVNKMQNISLPENEEQQFSISVPKASYISHAFTSFITKLDKSKKLLIDFKECSSIGAIENIISHNFNLGIVRYQKDFSPFFQLIFKEKGLVQSKICEFTCYIAFSKNDELACKETLTVDDFSNYIELTHGDSYLPYINNRVFTDEIIPTDKKIRIYDSMGQLKMLKTIPNTFMLVYPLDHDTLEKYELVQRQVEGFSKTYCDVLIYKKNYHFSHLDKQFVEELEKNRSY